MSTINKGNLENNTLCNKRESGTKEKKLSNWMKSLIGQKSILNIKMQKPKQQIR